MILKLIINGQFHDQVEFNPPAYDRYLDFEINEEIRELCVKRMVRLIKKNNEKAIEYKDWEVYLFITAFDTDDFGRFFK